MEIKKSQDPFLALKKGNFDIKTQKVTESGSVKKRKAGRPRGERRDRLHVYIKEQNHQMMQEYLAGSFIQTTRSNIVDAALGLFFSGESQKEVLEKGRKKITRQEKSYSNLYD